MAGGGGVKRSWGILHLMGTLLFIPMLYLATFPQLRIRSLRNLRSQLKIDFFSLLNSFPIWKIFRSFISSHSPFTSNFCYRTWLGFCCYFCEHLSGLFLVRSCWCCLECWEVGGTAWFPVLQLCLDAGSAHACSHLLMVSSLLWPPLSGRCSGASLRLSVPVYPSPS